MPSSKLSDCAELRAFRQRNGLKQEAAASLLGVSEVYISRIENGTVSPSETVMQRLRMLSKQPEHRPIHDLVKASVRHCPALTFLISHRDGAVVVDEHSRAFHGQGHPFDQHRRAGVMKTDAVGPGAVRAVKALAGAGGFDGRLGYIEIVWTTTPPSGQAARHFRTIITPMRSDDGDWRLLGTLRDISEADRRRAEEAWGGPLRFFGHDEEPPHEWP